MNRYTWFAAMSRNEPGSMNRAPGCDPCNEPNWFERFIATKSNISHVLGSVNYSYAQSSFSQRCLPIKAHSGFVLSPNLEHQPEPLCRAPQGSLGLPGVPYRPSQGSSGPPPRTPQGILGLPRVVKFPSQASPEGNLRNSAHLPNQSLHICTRTCLLATKGGAPPTLRLLAP